MYIQISLSILTKWYDSKRHKQNFQFTIVLFGFNPNSIQPKQNNKLFLQTYIRNIWKNPIWEQLCLENWKKLVCIFEENFFSIFLCYLYLFFCLFTSFLFVFFSCGFQMQHLFNFVNVILLHITQKCSFGIFLVSFPVVFAFVISSMSPVGYTYRLCTLRCMCRP